MRRIIKILTAAAIFAAVPANAYAYKACGELIAENRFEGWNTHVITGNALNAAESTSQRSHGGDYSIVIHREKTSIPVKIYNNISLSDYGVGMELYVSEDDSNLRLYFCDDLGAVYYPRTECEYSGGWYRLTAVGYANSGRTIVRAGAEYTNNSAASGDIYLDDLLVKIAPVKTEAQIPVLKNTACIALDNIKVYAYNIFGEKTRVTNDNGTEWTAISGSIENGVACADEQTGKLKLRYTVGGVSGECSAEVRRDLTLISTENGVRVLNSSAAEVTCTTVAAAVSDGRICAFDAKKCTVAAGGSVDLDFSGIAADGSEMRYFIVK